MLGYNPLDVICKKYGSDKRRNNPNQDIYHDYVDTYHEYLKSYRKNYLSILEIGVKEGWSHLMWEEYFPNGKIFGIDDFSEIDSSNLNRGQIKIIKGNQDDEELINKNFQDISLDIIIDDGSHRSWHQQKSFKYLWPKLKFGGYYFIEDLAVDFMREFREFDDWGSSTIGWLRSMMSDNPKSYYMDDEFLKNVKNEIEFIESVGELAVIKKREGLQNE